RPNNARSRSASSASLASASVNCRVTRSSMLMATRSLNALWSEIIGAISWRRKSATALVSSIGVGSSCIVSLPLVGHDLVRKPVSTFRRSCPRGQQPQQVDLGLRGAAPDHGALHRMIRRGAKPLHHAAAHHAPAQGAHHLPEFDALPVNPSARILIAREQFL